MNLRTYPSMLDVSVRPGLLTDVVATVLGSLLIVISAQIFIPLPFTPVPITAQTLAVLFLSSFLGSKRGPLSVLLYVLYGALGFPVFAEHSGGIQVLIGPTAGYILGFVLSSYIVGKFCERGWDRGLLKCVFSMFIGQFFIFVPGLLWLGLFVGYNNVLEMGLYPFIIGGVVKTLLGASSSILAWKLILKIKGK